MKMLPSASIFRFCCKKSGSFTKQAKNFTFRQINNSHSPEKWYIKVPIIASMYETKIFATEPEYPLCGNYFALGSSYAPISPYDSNAVTSTMKI
jgi:hypothetical protein